MSAPRPRPISSARAPAAVGPYSQAIRAGGFVFVSGQIGVDPAAGALVAGGIGEETRRALLNVEGILGSAGLHLADVVKTTVYLIDIEEWPDMNVVYAEFFPANPPARAAVAVRALPKGARVEIEAVAAER